MYQMRLWDEEPSQEAKDKVQKMFVDHWNHKRKIQRFFNCLFWFFVLILGIVICALSLYWWNSVI